MEHRELDIKNAYNKLLEFELELQKQEGLRENLGSPFGRAPPFKFNFSASASKLTSPNYASGMARHPFLSTFSTEDFSRTVKKTSSVRRMRLPKLVKVVNHAFQPSQALLAQISERNALKESLLHKFPSRAQDLIEEVLAKEESYETLYEVPSNKMGFNPFLRPNGKNYFFPLEMFYDDEVDLLALNYPQKAVGLYNLGETYEWKPCKVLKFIQETGKFFIQWDVNQTEKKPGLQGKGEKGIKGNKGEIKETSRHTVRFLFEDEDAFNKKIEQAKQFRVNYEAGIRYLARLEMETFKNLSQVFIPKIQLERIIRKIKSDINELTHEDIYDEIRNNYVRGVVEFTFKIQHFIGEAKRLEKPWQDELLTAENMQEKTRNFRHSDLSWVCKNLEKELLLTTEDFALVRQAIHNLSEISGVRIYKILIDLSHKKTVHEDKKLKWVLKDWYSDVKLKVDKYVKGSIKILKQSESSLDKQFYMSQVMFESNLQVCIKKSTDDLIDHLKTYYAVLPFNGFDLEIFDHLSVSVMQTRQKMRTKLNLYKDHEVDFLIEKRLKEKSCKGNQFEAALECLSKILQRQIFSKNYSNYDSPAPLMILSIISRFSLAREVKGRKFKLFTIAKALEMKKDSLFATSLKKVAGSIFRENEISRIMDNTARTGRSSRKIPLLAESNIKWLDPNYEEGGLFIYPNLRFIEESLRDILKSPIKSFEKIKSISKQKMLDDKLFIANSGECYSQALSEILDILQFSLLGPHAILRVLSKFEYLVKDSPEKILEEIMISTSNNYKELHLAMKRIKRDSEEIENLLPTTMNFGLFQLELGKIKLEILNNSKELLLAILNEIEKEKCKLLDEAHCNFKLLIKKLVSPPTDVEEFVDIRDYLDKKGDIEDFRPIKNSLHVIEIITGIMHEFHFAKTGNIEERYWQTLSWPRELAEGQKKAKKTIEKLYPHFKMKIRENIEELNLNIDGIVKEITAFSGYSKLEEARDYAGRAKKLKKFQQESNKINTREHILKFDISDFSRIDKLIESFEKYEKLWQFIYDWNSKSNEWTNLAFRMIDSKQVEETLRYGFNLLNMIEMNCGSDTVLMSISLVMHTKLNLFEKFLPVIFCLRDESIELRHWKEIWNLIKDPIPSNLEREKMDRQTLQNLLDKDVLNKLMQISQIASRARHESEIEKTLKKIKSDLSMQVPTYTLEDFDRIELVTDINGLADIVREHILTLTFLQKNVRYISHCKSAIEQEKRKAIEIESFLEDFGKLQQNFKELFPLFLLPVIPT
jgi:hypothetical protein